MIRTIALALTIAFACDPTNQPDAGPTRPPDAAEPVALCDTVPAELAGCASCHDEYGSIDGFRARPNGSCLESDTNGRQAFYVLFTQSHAITVPEHTAPYEWAESCFCVRDPDSPHECHTLAGEFETDCGR
jgi:hypothetical protein